MKNFLRALPSLCLPAALAGRRVQSQTATPSTAVSIAPADKNLLYVGRWDRDDPTDAYGVWIGSCVRARLTGTSVAVNAAGDRRGHYIDTTGWLVDAAARLAPLVAPLLKG